MVKVDANQQSFFKHVIEQRAANESNKALHYWLKILANSGSYGLFVELNPNEAKNAKIRVFSGEEPFDTSSDVIEVPGKWFAPHIGSLITAGGRLLLAMLEKCIADLGGTYLFCDTDSAAIVSTQNRQQIAMPDDAEPITALSRDEVQGIVDRFESLNPYDRKLVPGSILKIHKINWDRNKSAASCLESALPQKDTPSIRSPKRTSRLSNQKRMGWAISMLRRILRWGGTLIALNGYSRPGIGSSEGNSD